MSIKAIYNLYMPPLGINLISWYHPIPGHYMKK